jgi:hypothetical protein
LVAVRRINPVRSLALTNGLTLHAVAVSRLAHDWLAYHVPVFYLATHTANVAMQGTNVQAIISYSHVTDQDAVRVIGCRLLKANPNQIREGIRHTLTLALVHIQEGPKDRVCQAFLQIPCLYIITALHNVVLRKLQTMTAANVLSLKKRYHQTNIFTTNKPDHKYSLQL